MTNHREHMVDDQSKTKDQLIDEIRLLRQRLIDREETDAIQKNAEKRISESEQKYRSLFKSATDAIYLIDPETQKILDCNPKASEIVGYTCREITTMKVEDLYPSAEQDIVSKIFKKVTERGSLTGISGINQLRKDGILVPVEINATTIELGGKKLSLGILRDISERKRVERELKDSEEKYRALFKHMFIGCALHKIILDKKNRPVDYVFMEINDAFERLTGLKRSNIIGKKVTEVIPGIEKSEFDWIGEYGKIAQEGGTLKFEQYSEPFKKWYSVSAYRPMQGYFIALFEDITKRKKMEEQLQAATITDNLTGLLNRRGFFTLAGQQCKVSDRNRRRMFLFYLDLNELKAINDKLGHNAGDQALIDTANVLKKSFRKSDILARIGGDEFVVLITERKGQKVEQIIINNLKKNLKIYNKKEARNYKLSLSIGIAYYDPEHPCPIDELLGRADKLMYESKKNNKHVEGILPLFKVKKIEDRVYERFKISDDCVAKLAVSEAVHIKDVGIGGICLKTTQYLKTNNIYNINMRSPAKEEITLKGEVVWSSLMEPSTKRGDRKPRYEAGMKFIEMDESLTSSLQEFITSLSNETSF